jgi:hypothetical protein
VEDDADETRRLKFYGPSDLGNYWQAERLLAVLAGFDPSKPIDGINDIVELTNATLFVDHDLFPANVAEPDRERFRALAPEIRRVAGVFFNSLTDASFATVVSGIPFTYRGDVLDFLAKFKVFDQCDATVVLGALQADRFHLGDLLGCRALVRAYDEGMRTLILDSSQSAELILSKYLLDNERRSIHLPASLTPADCRDLLDAYLDSEDAKPNYMQLIANARPIKQIGLDAKLKLKARRTHEAFIKNFFAQNAGMKSGVEVSLSDTQVVDMVFTLDDMDAKFSYSSAWLGDNLDYPTILNNFIYVFEWVTERQILELPSYRSELGVMERIFMSGRDEYVIGAAFRMKDSASLLKMHMYRGFLQARGVDLEAVIAWFFTDYLAAEFDARNFKFRPSSPSATHLEKCRHLFSEMESVLKQYSLYVDNGELDLELLSMTSEQLAYDAIPSVVDGKYVYVTDHPDIQGIQHLLFSDQSHLGYINEQLHGHTLIELLASNTVTYDDFADHQRGSIDFLINHGLLQVVDCEVMFGDLPRLVALRELWDYEAASYWHYTTAGRAAIDGMFADGWLERHSTLLTSAEVAYINYYLNQKGPSGGPDLRNRYLHGSQADYDDDKNAHFHTYLIALRLLVAFVIKINDDLWLRAAADEATPPKSA